jgi:predicted ribosome quality control (RQC) complex YloA/Tae2 family protein
MPNPSKAKLTTTESEDEAVHRANLKSSSKKTTSLQQLDAVVLAAWAAELNELLTGAKISKVNHLNHRDFCLTMWGHQLDKENNRLLISINKQLPACFLTDTHTVSELSEKAFKQPTGFCMLLRKHLQNGIIERVHSLTGERVILLDVKNTNEMGQQVQWQIIIELMGRHSNLLLVEVDTNTIIGTAHHVTDTMSREREVYPGIPYSPPPIPKEKDWIGKATEPQLTALFKQHNELKSFTSAVFTQYWGVGKSTLVDVHAQHNFDAPQQAAALHQLIHQPHQGHLVCTNAPPSLHWHFGDDAHHSDEDAYKVEAIMRQFYVAGLTQLQFQHTENNLRQAIAKGFQKLDDATVDSPDEQNKLAELYQEYGHHLMTAISCKQVPHFNPTEKTITLTNFNTNEPMIIPIDTSKGWQDNAQAYYQKSKKILRQLNYQAEQQDAMNARRNYLTELSWALDAATTPLELRQLRDELMAGGFIRDRYAQSKRQHQTKKKMSAPQAAIGGLLHLQNAEGVRFLVGKQNQANDAIVGKLSRSHDMWLHAHNMPGAHVLIQTEGHEISDETLHDGLHLAAYFSPGKDSPNLPVIYTQRRYVKKIPGSYPGHVNYREEYTAYITVDEARIETLLKSQEK